MIIRIDLIDIPRPIQNIDEIKLQELADSIAEIGLSQAIIVSPSPGERFSLVSGEKRLLACARLGWEEIEASIREMSDKRSKETRIHENLKRFDLPWPEQVKLIEELHSLRQEEHGLPQKTGRPSKEGPPKTKVGWSLKDTAEELSMGIGSLSDDLTLARALQKDPTLAQVKDKKTAVKLARVAIHRYTTERSAGLPTKFEGNDIYCGDSSEILKQLPPQSIDHCVTDPPWIKFFDRSLTIDDRTLPVFRELYRVLKSGALIYIFCGLDDYEYYVGHDEPGIEESKHVAGKLEKLGYAVSKTPIIWQKLKSLSRRGVAPWEYSRDFEFIIVAAKPPAALSSAGQLSGIKPFPIVHPSQMIHPNEKPIELMSNLIKDCSYEGNIIIDPFAGSGVVGSACKLTNRKYVLIERDPSSYEKIVKRMEKKNV